MEFIGKYRKEIVTSAVLIFLYFLLRLPNLTSQPIFVDEAIYIRWAQVMRSEPTLRFLPQASEGKQPLFMWTLMPLFKVFSDPLFAGRFLSIITGFFTLIGICFLTYYLFKSKTATFITCLLYIISPFSIFFNRLALVDSMLTMFGTWTLIFAILTAKNLRLDFSMLTGFSLGGALLTKSPAIFFELMLPFVFILNGKLKNFMKMGLLFTVTIGIGNIMYNILRLGPSFNEIAIQNQKYVFPISHLWLNPKDPFIYHIRDMLEWFWLLGPNLLIVFTAMGIFFGLKKSPRNTLTVLLWALIPLFAINMFAKVFTARYILYTTPPIFILASLPFVYIKREIFKKILVISLIGFIIYTFRLDYLLLANPHKLPLPKSERTGYFEQWTAGYGFKEIAEYLKEESKKESIVVGTEGFFGTLPDGIYIYLDKANIPIVGSTATISAEIRNAAKDHKTFFIGNKNSFGGTVAGVKIIKEYPKAKPIERLQDATILYQVLP